MALDPLAQQLLDAIRPSDWSKISGPHKGIYGLLYGAARSLATSKNIFEQSSSREYGSWDPQVVFTNLAESLNSSREPTWQIESEARTDIKVWLIGYFINKAYQNIAAAIDYVVNLALCQKLELQESEIEGVLHLYLSSRLELLRGALRVAPGGIGANAQAIKTVGELLLGCRRCGNGIDPQSDDQVRSAIQTLDWLTDRVSSHTFADVDLLREVGKQIDGDHYTDADCVAMTFARVNIWKHKPGFGRRPASRKPQTHIAWAVEWTVAARALVCVGEFWRTSFNPAHPTAQPPLE